MTLIEDDILSTPTILRQTLARVEERSGILTAALQGPVLFLGSGSSYCVGVAAASLYEAAHATPAQSMLGSEYRLRPGWTHVAISRTGRTTELVEAMRRAGSGGARCLLIAGEADSPAGKEADEVLLLEFAPEAGVVQTRFISAAILALRLCIGGEDARRTLAGLPDQVERALTELQTDASASISRFEHVVYLGRGWRYGLALAARLNLQETSLLVPEAHQTLDYRHGPIASAGERTLVWCFDPAGDAESAAVLDDVRRTGATVRLTGDDPQVALAQAQLLAARLAVARGVDPDAPRHLARAIVLPTTEA